MWYRIRGQITLFRRLYKRDLVIQNIECAILVFVSIKGSIILTTEEEDRLEDMEEDGTNSPDFEGEEEEGAEQELSRLIKEKIARGSLSPESYKDLRRTRRERELRESSLPIPIQVDSGIISSSSSSEPEQETEPESGQDMEEFLEE